MASLVFNTLLLQSWSKLYGRKRGAVMPEAVAGAYEQVARASYGDLREAGLGARDAGWARAYVEKHAPRALG